MGERWERDGREIEEWEGEDITGGVRGEVEGKVVSETLTKN